MNLYLEINSVHRRLSSIRLVQYEIRGDDYVGFQYVNYTGA